ncbi:uncharacterized protein PV09_06016 [Verruconis gallopava]|uniref:Uncharacterized protein n=1 Tax=Verruconis gallopava TaxID=253628 RepID=A0A0D1XJT6_9PEZI|nr:uncharacterized protein PV09_06016 [Verruconis gallopava]KIW02561.1 hypothetical protein PV09_06016 [Verruconis gallopava]
MLPLLSPAELSSGACSNIVSAPVMGAAAHPSQDVNRPEGELYFRPASFTSLEDAMTISAIPPPPPAPSDLAEPTPYQENPPDLSTVAFEHMLGLSGVPTEATQTVPKPTRNLRLPSFDALGISSLSTVKQSILAGQGVNSSSLALPMQQDILPYISRSSSSYSPTSPQPAVFSSLTPNNTLEELKSAFKTVPNFVLTQTPPDEVRGLEWDLPKSKTTASAEENQTLPAQTSSLMSFGVDSALNTESGAIMNQVAFSLRSGRAPWLSDALRIILDLVHQHRGSDAIKILSHALPSPSANGHAFPLVIDTIQQCTSSSSIMWLNVWHAVSGRFNFEDLPKSPPTTPAPPFEGDDYFTQRVFDYAVEVPDYQQRITAQPMRLRQQRPAIAPSSIDISIVERYIPPTSSAEFEELFTTTGRSFLCDRIVELSPSNGTLLFIYPTKSGGETFKKRYLEPILDPTLRSMMISHGLPVTLVEDVGRMTAIQHLLSFEDMKSQLQTFLNTLNNGGTPSRRFHRPNDFYSLMYAQPQKVHLERDVWARDWWNKQEKLRIQRAFESHDVQSANVNRQVGVFQASAHLATARRETEQAAQSAQSKLIQRAQTQSLLRDAERTQGERQPGHNEEMILRLLQQVATKEYRDGPPTVGLEVGVFVIRKTARTSVLA